LSVFISETSRELGNIVKRNFFKMNFAVLIILGVVTLLQTGSGLQAQICASVRIQIEQELSLERQGFIAKMGIQNSPEFQMQDIVVTVNFKDKSGNPIVATTDSTSTDTAVRFFITPSGTLPTSINPGSSANLEWLIIPAPGAGGDTPDGKLYYVGATLSYTSGGRQEVVTVTPDFIYVKPMPSLQLDYFLPHEVYSDDPQTTVIEPAVPFYMGVRVQNNGKGIARNLKIQSGQPKIVANAQGLLVNFAITGSEINGQPGQNSLLADFGNIQTNSAGVARWVMMSSLSGTFTNFNATFSHADELGGSVTSLIPQDGIRTHTLVRDVLVDLPGSDRVRDFLAKDGPNIKVYENQNTDTDVQQVDSVLGSGGMSRVLTLSGGSTGFIYSKLELGEALLKNKVVAAATRSDGKVIPLANAWVSKTWDLQVRVWRYFVNIFDVNNQGMTYLLVFSDPQDVNRAPDMVLPSDLIVQTGQPNVFTIRASDPDGIKPEITLNGLPVGALFTDNTPPTGAETIKNFAWTPLTTQTGTYTLRFSAKDGVNTTTKSLVITVINGTDTKTAWQEQKWPGVTDLSIIGDMVDPDMDGLSNLLEYALNLDPKKANAGGFTQIGIDEVNGQKFLTLTYTKRTDDPNLVFTVLGSNVAHAGDNQWTPQTQSVTVPQEDVSQGMQKVKVRDQVAIEDGPARRYLKLKVSTATVTGQ